MALHLSLEERMKQMGILLGPEGRSFMVSSFAVRTTDQDAEFVRVIDAYKNVLFAHDSSDKRALIGESMDVDPSPKRGKQQGMPFRDLCVEWYKQQTGLQPHEAAMTLFDEETAEQLLKGELSNTEKLLIGKSFKSLKLAEAFVDFVKSSRTTAIVVDEPDFARETVAAFSIEYVDPNETVGDFIEYVDECQTAYREFYERYNSPYISVCQSSGYGKSRMIQQVSKRRKLLYVCVGNSHSSYPAANLMARNFLFSNDPIEANRQLHLQQRLEHCVSWCLQNDITNTEQFGEKPAAFWDTIIHHDPICFDASKIGQDETLWIAFDEARSLLETNSTGRSDFRLLRRALAAVSRKIGFRIFAILADTKSSIANFTPSADVDPSLRLDPEGRNIFHPYILISTHDALKSALAGFQDDWSFVRCGRPLWSSLFPDPSTRSRDLMAYATRKLLKSRSEDNAGVIMTTDKFAILATVICRTGVYLSPQSSTASELAANYMATLLLCDHAHEHFLVTYLSDPVLTIASAQLWYNNNFLATLGLPVLRQNLVHGAVLEGYRGELVGRLLLLIGMDMTSSGGDYKNSYDGKWYKVSEFMTKCFGISDCLADKDAYVGFSHFVQCVREPTSYQDLKDMLVRRAACCLPPNQAGIDLLIPFWVQRPGKEPLISYLLIQIKNKNRPENVFTMRDKMNPRKCFSAENELRLMSTDIILVMMEVGATSERPMSTQHIVEKPRRASKRLARQPRPPSGWTKWVYSARTIAPETYPFLQGRERLAEELVLLAKGSLDLEQWMECDKAQNATLSAPGVDRRDRHIRKIVLGTE